MSDENNKLTNRKLLEDTHDTVTQLKTVLIGVPGTEDGGLVQEVKDNRSDIKDLGKSHGKLKRNFWLLVGTLAGSGAIGSGLYNLLS